MNYNYPHYPHFNAELGASEKQTESYIRYGEGASQLATPLCAKSTSGVSPITRGKQGGAVRKVWNEK